MSAALISVLVTSLLCVYVHLCECMDGEVRVESQFSPPAVGTLLGSTKVKVIRFSKHFLRELLFDT